MEEALTREKCGKEEKKAILEGEKPNPMLYFGQYSLLGHEAGNVWSP